MEMEIKAVNASKLCRVYAGFCLGLLFAPAAFSAEDKEAMSQADMSAAVYAGWQRYENYCAWCHGAGATGTSAAPDLREMVGAHAYDDIVQTIALGKPDKGMPAWGDLLTAQEIRSIYWYISARADGLLPAGWLDEAKLHLPKDWSGKPAKAQDPMKRDGAKESSGQHH